MVTDFQIFQNHNTGRVLAGDPQGMDSPSSSLWVAVGWWEDEAPPLPLSLWGASAAGNLLRVFKLREHWFGRKEIGKRGKCETSRRVLQPKPVKPRHVQARVGSSGGRFGFSWPGCWILILVPSRLTVALGEATRNTPQSRSLQIHYYCFPTIPIMKISWTSSAIAGNQDNILRIKLSCF